MRRLMKHRLSALLLALPIVVALGAQAGATHTTVNWKGQDWDISHNATAAVDVNDHLTITRTTGTSDAQVHINRIAPAPGGDSFVNDDGTPWVRVSYIDNGMHRGVDFFIDSERPGDDPRLQAGSLFGCDGLGYTRYNPAIEEIVFGEGCEDPAVFSPGTAHTIYVGQREDGTIDYNFDGTWYRSTLLRDNTGAFDFNDVYLRLRGASGTTATFTDFDAGANHPTSKDDCKNSTWTDPGVFKNQGSCVGFVSSYPAN
jgi:hypothetical protein